jgi:hypothetical protein
MSETSAATVSLYEPGIVFIRFREGVDVEPHHAEEIVAAAAQVANGQRHGNIVDVRKLRYMSKQSRDVFARQQRSTVSAVAVVVDSSLQSALGNLYLNVSRPRICTRLFSDEHHAVVWLRQQNERR